MSFFSRFSTKKHPLEMVVDFGSYDIKALIFEKPSWIKEDKTKDTFAFKAVRKRVWSLPSSAAKGGLVGSQPAVKSIIKLHEVLFMTIKELGRVPEKITIGISAGLAEVSLKTWNLNYAGRERFFSRGDLRAGFEGLFEQNRDSQRGALMAYPLGLTVNGYKVEPEVLTKFKAAKVSFETLLFYFASEIGEGLAETRQSLGGLPVEFVPSAFSCKEALENLLGMKDALLVDIGGRETALVLLKKGSISGINFLPMGVGNFRQAVAKNLSLSSEEAGDAVRQYGRGMLIDSKQSGLSEALGESAKQWRSFFIEGLDSFYKNGPLPENILLFGEGAFLPEVQQVVKASDWIQDFSYVSTPQVKVLEARSLFQGDSLGGTLQGPEDLRLASLVFYATHYQPLF